MAVGVPESPEMALKEPELNIGEWRVDAASSQISRDGEVVRVDARVMRLLTCLAARAGEVVTTDELLAEVWGGVVVTQDSVYQAVASLRRVLGDDPKSPTYIATVPRRGYRLVARVSHGTGAEAPAAPGPTSAMTQAPASGPCGLVTVPPISFFLTGTALCASACVKAKHPATPIAAALRKRLRLKVIFPLPDAEPYLDTLR